MVLDGFASCGTFSGRMVCLRRRAAILALILTGACSPSAGDTRVGTADGSSDGGPNLAGATAPGPGDPAVTDPVERAQARVTRRVIDLEGVTGTAMGLCNGKPCIKIYVEKSSAELQARLPRSEAGYPVVVEVTGKIRRP